MWFIKGLGQSFLAQKFAIWGHRRIFPKEYAKGAAIGHGFATEASCFFVWRPRQWPDISKPSSAKAIRSFENFDPKGRGGYVLLAQLYGPAVLCKLKVVSRWQLVLRICIRPLNGARRSWPSWITRRAAESGHRRLFCEATLEFCDQCRERFWLFVRR